MHNTERETLETDVLIVGAGVMGASIAFHLAERRVGRVTLVDRARAGEGMSGRSSALVRMHYGFPPEVRLAVLSRGVFKRWRDVTGAAGDYRTTGFVRIVPERESTLLERNVAMQRELGIDVRLVRYRDDGRDPARWYQNADDRRAVLDSWLQLGVPFLSDYEPGAGT